MPEMLSQDRGYSWDRAFLFLLWMEGESVNLPKRIQKMKCAWCGSPHERTQIQYLGDGPTGNAGISVEGWLHRRYYIIVHCGDHRCIGFWHSLDVEITKTEAEEMTAEHTRLNERRVVPLPKELRP